MNMAMGDARQHIARFLIRSTCKYGYIQFWAIFPQVSLKRNGMRRK